jgi:hypothetical protein
MSMMLADFFRFILIENDPKTGFYHPVDPFVWVNESFSRTRKYFDRQNFFEELLFYLDFKHPQAVHLHLGRHSKIFS